MDFKAQCNDLSAKLAGYRASDGYIVDPDHVEKWAYQFDDDVRIPLLTEMRHVIDSTYFSEDEVRGFFEHQITFEQFASDDPDHFWRTATILDIQAQGQSQREISKQFFRSLEKKLDLSPNDCGQGGQTFIYLDDAIFSGSRAGGDLKEWIIKSAPDEAVVKILVIATYELGEFQLKKRLEKVAADAGKSIKVEVWAALRLENRKYYKNTSEILWPKEIPQDKAVGRYLERDHRWPFEPRTFDGKLAHPVFSSDAGRALLETEMLKAGAKIIEFSKKPSEIVRPLGFGAFGVGFGSTLVTYRNCPNNCPLAWWWGDPAYPANHPFSKWYPLVQRKTYGGSSGFDAIDF